LRHLRYEAKLLPKCPDNPGFSKKSGISSFFGAVKTIDYRWTIIKMAVSTRVIPPPCAAGYQLLNQRCDNLACTELTERDDSGRRFVKLMTIQSPSYDCVFSPNRSRRLFEILREWFAGGRVWLGGLKRFWPATLGMAS